MFIKYLLEDDSEIWIESADESSIVKSSTGEKIIQAKLAFIDALETVKKSSVLLRKQFADSLADEIEITFGLKASGEIGNNIFAVSKAGIEANYIVKLIWKKHDENYAQRPVHLTKRRLSSKRNLT